MKVPKECIRQAKPTKSKTRIARRQGQGNGGDNRVSKGDVYPYIYMGYHLTIYINEDAATSSTKGLTKHKEKTKATTNGQARQEPLQGKGYQTHHNECPESSYYSTTAIIRCRSSDHT